MFGLKRKKDPELSRLNIQITWKGIGLIAAIESGLLPEIEKNGQVGYDDALFEKFWDKFMRLSLKHEYVLEKQCGSRGENR